MILIRRFAAAAAADRQVSDGVRMRSRVYASVTASTSESGSHKDTVSNPTHAFVLLLVAL